MNSLSISGKNWIYRKYNQEDLNFLKESFSLDEITSKLLSIRKITISFIEILNLILETNAILQ